MRGRQARGERECERFIARIRESERVSASDPADSTRIVVGERFGERSGGLDGGRRRIIAFDSRRHRPRLVEC